MFISLPGIGNIATINPQIANALTTAYAYHDLEKKQTYRGGGYTERHIIPVWNTVKRFSSAVPLEVEIASILHDIVEDTSFDLNLVRQNFGDKVSDLVWRLTDEPGLSRIERKSKTYPKIRMDKWAILIKLADRYVNTLGSEKKEMYQKEFASFKKNLYISNMWETPWSELEKITKE